MKERTEAEILVKKPFPQETEYNEKKERLEYLNIVLQTPDETVVYDDFDESRDKVEEETIPKRRERVI